MARVSTTDAALVGFRIARERPMVVVIWSIVLAVVQMATAALMVVTIGPQLAEFTKITQNTTSPPDGQAMLGLLAQMGPTLGVLTVFGLIYYGILYAGANRVVLRPLDGGIGNLKLGADEFRQILALLVVALILIAAYIGAIVAIAVALGVAAAGLGAGIAALLVFVAVVGFIVLFAFLLTRLALVSPHTFVKQRLAIGEAWRMTQGNFWPIFWAGILAFILSFIVQALALAVFLPFALILGGGFEAFGQVFQPDYSNWSTAFSPVMIIYHIFNGVAAALGLLILSCVPAEIYRQINGTEGTFD